MRAITAPEYGGPEVLELADRPEPKVGPDSVLVDVRASSVNPVDYKIVRGSLDAAFPTTFPLIPGWDVAGVVAAVGPAITHVEVGQPVFGYARKDWIGEGTWAERVAVPGRGIAALPETVALTDAACVPLAGLTAYQCLVDKLVVGEGDTVLIHAASGGVGTLAVQIARARGADVIGTASEGSRAHVEELGAAHVVYGDGLEERVRDLAPDGVDAVLDLVGGDALRASPALLRDDGRLCSVVDADTVLSLGGHYVFVRPDVAQLEELGAMVDSSQLRVRIQDRFPLEDTARAVEAAETSSVRGKIIIEVG